MINAEGTCKWVSVSENPNRTDWYRVRSLAGDEFLAYFSFGVWKFEPKGNGIDPIKLTHWLEVIPPPIPKQKKLKEYTVMLPSSRQYRMDVIGYMNGVDEVKAFIPHDAKSFKVTYEIEEDT